MERGVYPRKEIQRRLRRFVPVELYVDAPDPARRSKEWAAMLHDRFGTDAIPLYVALSPDGRTLGTLAFQGGSAAAFAPTMAAWMDEMLEKAPK